MTTDKKRILFVDDEPAILAGLQNLLYKDRKRWELVFALGGQAALEHVRARQFDVVISDMRMPGVDGAQLLSQIRLESPGTVRIMLSGHADREAIVRALPALHQLLSKPCGVETLRGAIERGLGGDLAERVKAIVGRIDMLPTPRGVYQRLVDVLADPASTVADVTGVVGSDPSLAAKVLQLVNSAYFGAGQTTSSIAQAVAMLGTERIRYIALTASVFSTVTGEPFPGFSIRAIQEASLRAAALVRERAPAEHRDVAFAAALVHDVGRVVLALGIPDEYRAVVEQRDRDLVAVEHEALGVTHAEVGASLLSIWGLPDAIVELVRHHHDPASAPPGVRAVAELLASAIADAG